MAQPSEQAGADGGADAIRNQLASIRGELFDVADADASVALILSKVRELTECENRVVEEQRCEIELLRNELEEARTRMREGQHAATRGTGAYTSLLHRTPSHDAAPDGLESVPSFGSITINSSSSVDTGENSGFTGFTNESERPTSYSIQANQQLATRANLSQSIAMATNELREMNERKESVAGEVEELETKLEALAKSKSGILGEIDELRGQVAMLLQERTKLVQEVEVYGDQAGLAADLDEAAASNERLKKELHECREEMDQVRASAREVKEQAVRQWEQSVREKEAAEQKLAKEWKAFREAEEAVREAREEAERESLARTEMEKELRGLYEEKISAEAALEELRTAKGIPRQQTNGNGATPEAADIQRLKQEVQALRGENASLRSLTQRDSERIAGLNDEIRSLRTADRSVDGAPTPANTPMKGNPASSRKRALVPGHGSVGEDDREYQRTRFGSVGSVSLERIDGTSQERLHEADTVSLLFGQASIGPEHGSSNDDDEQSDHDEIRAHAEKLLYWANKASERNVKSDASVASQQAEGGAPSPSVPATIGLPPRSQSNVKKSSLRPPRCPPSIASGEGSLRSNKENGGDPCNRDRGADASGAFPSLTLPPRPKKNVSLSETDNVIHNLDYVDESPVLCCECPASAFSGNEPESEFYLPKLGLACSCGGNEARIADRASFARNPEALTSILRPWQCDFLATLDVATAGALLRSHKADANSMARSMKLWRMREGMAPRRSKECYVALKIWSRTCKVVLRSIREQRELAAEGGAEGEDVRVEKPHFLDITFADAHTIASISTLGQMSSVGGGARAFEMGEI